MSRTIMKMLMPILVVAGSGLATLDSFKVGTTMRTLRYTAPSTLPTNAPLLISMHGMGIGAGYHEYNMMDFDSITNALPAADKFLVVYPQGLSNVWDISGTTDINFMTTIIDTMYRRYKIDKNRVYFSGFSMGGMMTWYLICKKPNIIAAAVPDDGYLLGGLSGCVDGRHVPVLHIHGGVDSFVPYTGVHSFLKTEINAWGCPSTPDSTAHYPASTSRATWEHWGPCTKTTNSSIAGEINLLTVWDMNHDWPTKGYPVDGGREAWAFLKQFSLATTTSIDPDSPTPGVAELSVSYAAGRILMENSLGMRRVEVTDLRGKILISWETGGAPKNSLALPVSLERGVYLVGASGDGGRSAMRFLVP
jgi:poly(3-hydroxybutyrate) depolymerase